MIKYPPLVLKSKFSVVLNSKSSNVLKSNCPRVPKPKTVRIALRSKMFTFLSQNFKCQVTAALLIAILSLMNLKSVQATGSTSH